MIDHQNGQRSFLVSQLQAKLVFERIGNRDTAPFADNRKVIAYGEIPCAADPGGIHNRLQDVTRHQVSGAAR